MEENLCMQDSTGPQEVDAESSCSLEVFGVPCNSLADDLIDFFVDQDLSGDVTVVELNPILSRACLRFSCPEDADTVLRKEIFQYAGKVLKVCRPKEKAPNCKVKVTGFSGKYNSDILLYFFKNKKRGGEIESLDLDMDALSAVITFKEHDVAAKVIEGSSFRRGDDEMTVCWYIEEETATDQRMVAISGLPSCAEVDDLTCFLEEQSDLEGVCREIQHIEKEADHFLLTMATLNAAHTLIELKTLRYGEKMLEIKRALTDQMPKTDVLIRGLPDNCDKEIIRLFFQNKKRSDGGTIQSVDINHNAHTAHVVFCNESDAYNVVQRGEFRRQNGTIFYAEWFHGAKHSKWHEGKNIDPNTITLHNFNKDIDIDFVEDFLEDRTGDKVETTKKEKSVVEITFQSQKGPEMVSKLAQDGKLVMGHLICSLKCSNVTDTICNSSMSVEKQASCNSYVSVNGIPIGTPEEFVKIVLESKEKSGGGKIENIIYDSASGRANVLFQQADAKTHQDDKCISDADEFVERAAFSGVTINSERLTAIKQQGVVMPSLNTCAVNVYGIPDSYSQDGIRNFFENESHGGDDVQEIYVDGSCTVVTFEDSSTVTNIMNHVRQAPLRLENHVLKIEPLHVARVVTSPAENDDPYKVFVEDIPEQSTSKELQDFLNRHTKLGIEKMVFGMKVGTAMIFLSKNNRGDSDPWCEVRRRPFNGKILSIEYARRSNSIEVYEFEGLSEFKLKHYFESKRSVQPGLSKPKIAHTNHIKEFSCIIITFAGETDADNVLALKKHTTESVNLVVKGHFEKLGILPKCHDSTIPATSMPGDITVHIEQPDVFQYIKDNKAKQLLQMFRDEHTLMQMDDEHSSIILSCNLDKHHRHEKSSWPTRVNTLAAQEILVFESRSVPITWRTQQVLEILKDYADVITRENRDNNVEVVLKSDLITIIGKADEVSKLASATNQKVAEVIAQCKRLAEKSSSTVKIDDLKHGFLTENQCLDGLNRKYKDLDIRINTTEVVLEGCSDEVQAGTMEIQEILGNINSVEPSWCSAPIISLLSDKAVAREITSRCRDSSSTIYIHLHKGKKIILCGNDFDQVELFGVAIQREISEKIIQLTTELDPSAHSKIENVLLALKKEMGNRFVFCKESQDETIFTLTGFRSSVESAAIKIQSFMEQNKRIEEFIKMDEGHHRLLKLHPNQISDIKLNCSVEIQANHERTESGIIVSGIQGNICKAKDQIDMILKDVVTDSHHVSSTAMAKYFRKQSTNILQGLENEYQVAIHWKSKEENSPRARKKIVTNRMLDAQVFGTSDYGIMLKGEYGRVGHRRLNTNLMHHSLQFDEEEMLQNIHLGEPYYGARPRTMPTKLTYIPKLVQGKLTDSKADAIVNSTSADLDLSNGAVSSSILSLGGQSIQKQCDQWKLKNGKDLQPFVTIVPTDGGNLSCKTIYHAFLDKNSSNLEKSLQDLVMRCLDQAAKDGCQSIAFPSLGTGTLAFPRKLVASAMLRTASRFKELNPNTCLKEIAIILWPQDTKTIKEFEAEETDLKSPLRPSTSSEIYGSLSDPKKTSIQHSTQKSNATVLTYKNITVEVAQGDITQPTTDGIVYTTDTGFSHGSAIGKRLKERGGGSFERACSSATWTNGIAVTTGEFLGCMYIFHIDAPHTSKSHNWKQKIMRCLEEAEGLKITSISFPAIGTGMLQVPLSEIAQNMVDGIRDFASKMRPKHLKSIKMVIYERHNMEQFEELMKKGLEPRGTFHGNVSSFFADPISFVRRKASKQPERSSSVDVDVDEDSDCSADKEIDLVLTAFKLDAKLFPKVKERLKDMTDDMIKVKIFDGSSDSEDIHRLTDIQIEHIKATAKELDATVDIVKTDQEEGNKIVIKGLRDDVSEVFDVVIKLCREAAKHKDKKELFEKVKWQWEASDSHFENYSIDANNMIEQAYKNGDTMVSVNKDSERVVVDIKQLTERFGATTRKIRRDAPGEASVPGNWSKMNSVEKYMTVNLKQTDKSTKHEYSRVQSQFESSLSKGKATISAKIVEITRIQNPSQYRVYDVYLRHMRNANEQTDLWHGTTKDTIGPIMANGFNRAYAGENGTLYGKGVYFSKSAAYSHYYAKPDDDGLRYMFLCKVLAGEYTKGNGDCVEAPAKDPADPVNRYDSVVDNESKPTMYVIYKDNQAYPEYLITYKV